MKELRRIRKAADLARNLDVLAERYAGGNGGAPRWLQKLLARQRAKAQRPLAQLTVRLRRKRFDRRIRALLARIRWRGDGPEPVLMELAQAYLAECTEDLLSLESGAGTSEALHRLRIAGKRLRYALEIFAAVSPEQSERVYPELVALQDQLGTVNDHATAAMLFADFRRAGKARALAELAQREQQSAENAAAQCRSWLAGPSFRALCDALAGFAAEHHADAHAHRPR